MEYNFIDIPEATGDVNNSPYTFVDEAPQQSGQGSALNISKPLGVLGGIGGAYAGGSLLKGAGKMVYGLTLPPNAPEAKALSDYRSGISNYKPRTLVDTAIESPIFQKGNILRQPTSVLGNMGTRSQIGVQAGTRSKNIFENVVNPLLKKSTSKIDVSSYIGEIEKSLEKMAGKDPDRLNEYKKAIEELKNSFTADDYKSLSLKDAQSLKSSLQKRTPAKFFKGEEVTNAYRELRGMLSSKLRGALHDAIKSEHGLDSAKLYTDYANLKGLKKVGEKSMTQGGLKGGAGSFVSTVVDELATPVTTTTGKLAYKAGQALQAPGKAFVSGGKKLIEGSKTIAKKGLGVLEGVGKSLKNVTPAQVKGVLKAGLRATPKLLAEGAVFSGLEDATKKMPTDLYYKSIDDANKAISELKSGKDIGFMNLTKNIAKGKTKDEAIKALQSARDKAIESGPPKANKSLFDKGIDYIVGNKKELNKEDMKVYFKKLMDSGLTKEQAKAKLTKNLDKFIR